VKKNIKFEKIIGARFCNLRIKADSLTLRLVLSEFMCKFTLVRGCELESEKEWESFHSLIVALTYH